MNAAARFARFYATIAGKTLAVGAFTWMAGFATLNDPLALLGLRIFVLAGLLIVATVPFVIVPVRR